jgi:hypothetical protein
MEDEVLDGVIDVTGLILRLVVTIALSKGDAIQDL